MRISKPNKKKATKEIARRLGCLQPLEFAGRGADPRTIEGQGGFVPAVGQFMLDITLNLASLSQRDLIEDMYDR